MRGNQYNQLADLLTGIRFSLGLALIYLGLFQYQLLNPTRLAFLLIISWTTDILDGNLARSGGQPGITWLGRHDLTADLVMESGIALFLVKNGSMDLYLLLSAVAIGWFLWHWTDSFSWFQIVMALVYGAFLWQVLMYDPLAAGYIFLWLLLVVIFDYQRVKGAVRDFLQGLQAPVPRH